MVDIHSLILFEIREGCFPSPTPTSLCGNSSCCWRFCLLAVICFHFHHLADIYTIFLQFFQHFLLCRFIRALASKPHINICCNKLLAVLRFKFLWRVIEKFVTKKNFTSFYLIRNSLKPQFTYMKFLYSFPPLQTFCTNILLPYFSRVGLGL